MPAFTVGVGMTPFLPPSKKNPDYVYFSAEACREALRDASIPYSEIDTVSILKMSPPLKI